MLYNMSGSIVTITEFFNNTKLLIIYYYSMNLTTIIFKCYNYNRVAVYIYKLNLDYNISQPMTE